MSQKKSIMNGISAIAVLGASMAEEVTGVEIDTVNPRTAPSGQPSEFAWNDVEEEKYRDWIRAQQEEMLAANFDEYGDEEATRQRMKEIQEANSNIQVEWSDEMERAYRAKYIQLREERQEEADWTEYSGEYDAQEKSRAKTQERKKQSLSWDDQDERACMERYRKKYK